jgi:putative transposase
MSAPIRFFTVATARRRPHFRNPLHIQHLRTALRQVMRERPFRIRAMVVLPDHLHCIWTLPPGDDDYILRWRLVRLRVSRALGMRGFWAPELLQRPLAGAAQIAVHIDRIHHDPVHHGLVGRAGDWPYSSFARFVDAGHYPSDWAGE